MSCPNATAPIDISLSKITGKCDYKCSYSFNYNNSSCIVANRGDYLMLSYDKSSSPPVLYNSTGYDVEEVRIYIPSLHSYNNSKTDGELIVVHNSNTGANPLLVCIPIKNNNTSSVSATLFKNIVNTAADSAPADGESSVVNLPRYNLSDLVPKKPFFSYSASEPYQPCSAKVEYVVYAPLDASLDMNSDTLTKLQSIIRSNPYDIKTGPNLFFNEKGASAGDSGGDKIYIDCQPVGSSEETTEIITNTENSISYDDWFKNPAVQLFLGSLLFILILYIVKQLLDLIKPAKGGSAIKGITSGIMKGGII